MYNNAVEIEFDGDKRNKTLTDAVWTLPAP